MTHGGVEMGQGLHTKVAQIAASSFNIPLSSVFISETSTDKVYFSLVCHGILEGDNKHASFGH